jgi:hypothetical protein
MLRGAAAIELGIERGVVHQAVDASELVDRAAHECGNR